MRATLDVASGHTLSQALDDALCAGPAVASGKKAAVSLPADVVWVERYVDNILADRRLSAGQPHHLACRPEVDVEPLAILRYSFQSIVITRSTGRLSFRDTEDLLAQRAITVSHEAIQQWCRRFGPAYARILRRRQGRLGDTWHSDASPTSCTTNMRSASPPRL